MSAGHVRWPKEDPVWEFDWRLEGGAETEGIVFTRVRFKGRLVLFKASLPMIRVQYDTIRVEVRPNSGIFFDKTAGPYKDQLSADNATRDVSVRERAGQPRFLVVDSAHQIGHYRLVDRWIFREDGVILPQVYSAGLQFPANHRHHAYWRFDFDVDGSGLDLALNGTRNWPQEWGWGPGWHPITREDRFRRDAGYKFAVLDTSDSAQRGYHVVPGPNDGTPDSYAPLDYAVHRYREADDRHGELGSPTNDELWTLQKGASTEREDLVIWYCAHLSHEASDHGDEWHVCGPVLQPFQF